jgi:hypothetical protein
MQTSTTSISGAGGSTAKLNVQQNRKNNNVRADKGLQVERARCELPALVWIRNEHFKANTLKSTLLKLRLE